MKPQPTPEHPDRRKLLEAAADFDKFRLEWLRTQQFNGDSKEFKKIVDAADTKAASISNYIRAAANELK